MDEGLAELWQGPLLAQPSDHNGQTHPVLPSSSPCAVSAGITCVGEVLGVLPLSSTLALPL